MSVYLYSIDSLVGQMTIYKFKRIQNKNGIIENKPNCNESLNILDLVLHDVNE